MFFSVKQDLPQKKLLQNKSNRKESRFEGFDFLRAIFSIAIVADHAKLFTLAKTLGFASLTDVLYANFSYVAVPVFFQIALFLFYIKSEKVGVRYFVQKRLPKLILLYLFWVTSLTLFKFLFSVQAELDFSSARKIIEFIVSGGNSPFYFFFSLIFITILAQGLVSWFEVLKQSSVKRIINYCLLGFSCLLVFAFSLLDLINVEAVNINSIANIARWNYNPLNFLPYIFTAAIVVQEFKEGKLDRFTPSLRLKLYGLLALFLAFVLLEWNFLNELNYTRLSLVFSSWLFLYLALLSTQKAPAIVKLISKCSLGIYTLHLFFTHVFFLQDRNLFGALSSLILGLDIFAEFLVVLILSIVLTLLFRKIKGLKKIV